MYAQVQRKLVQSGDWDRIQALLAQKLSESGWIDEQRHNSKENARLWEDASFRTILEALQADAHTSVPGSVKREVVAAIRECLEGFFER